MLIYSQEPFPRHIVAKILVVDDEPNLVDSLQYSLRAEGYEVASAKNGEEALAKARDLLPDLIILDLMIPIINGKDVCRIIRKESNVPILMLTAKDNEIDRVVGLEIGADDYITKPFSMRELMARIHGVLRRVTWARNASLDSASDSKVLSTTRISINTESHEVFISGTLVSLKPKEYELLVFLMLNKGKVLSRDQILNAVWGYDFYGDTRTVDVHIRWLREKIEGNPSSPLDINTVRGVGYQLKG